MIKISEHQEQCTVVEWFRLQYPDELLFAIPNGGHRHINVARKLKNEGVTASIPDLFLASAKHGFNGLFIEMKSLKGKLTKQQAEMMLKLSDKNYMTVCCHGSQSAIDTITSYMRKLDN
jgi:rhodanese-related sulfurtransferase